MVWGGHPVVPASFVEKTILSHTKLFLASLAKSIDHKCSGLFLGLSPIPLICVSIQLKCGAELAQAELSRKARGRSPFAQW